MSDIMSKFAGKRILIWGLGLHGGGVGAAKFFTLCGARVTVTDLRTADQLAQSLSQLVDCPDIEYILGQHREDDFLHADFVVMNPAIKPLNELYVKMKNQGVKFITDVGIFLEHFPGMIVGVTGSKGKSTLTRLVYDLLSAHFTGSKKKFNKVVLGGNIRISVLDLLAGVDTKTIAVVELSSFMLEQAWYVKKSPHIAFITNIFNEHLDWHGSLNGYIEAKKNILRFQKKGEVAIVSEQCFELFEGAGQGHLMRYSGLSSNALFKLAEVLDIPSPTVYQVINDFRGLEGRQEKVAEINGVRYINDTTATHPAAVSFALEGLLHDMPAEKITLIAGGIDKGFGEEVMTLSHLLQKNKIKLVLLPGTLTDRLLDSFSEGYKKAYTYPAQTMQSAVVVATHECPSGGVVILSPGGASFNLFNNEFHRGKVFVDSVLALREVKRKDQKKFI